MGEPNEKLLEALNAADWENIWLKLLKFVRGHMCAHGSNGMIAEDLVNSVVERIYTYAYTGEGKGRRKWDPDKHPCLLAHLKWVVRSDLSDKGLLGQKSKKLDLTYEQNLDILTTSSKQSSEENPHIDSRISALKKEIAGDDDLECIIMALELGYDKPRDIAKETGIPVKRIYELNRKLKHKVNKVLSKESQQLSEGKT